MQVFFYEGIYFFHKVRIDGGGVTKSAHFTYLPSELRNEYITVLFSTKLQTN